MQLHCGISSEPYIFWQWKSPKCNQAQETVSEKCKKRTHLLRRLPLATHSCVLYVLQTYSRIRYMSVFLVSVSQKSQTFLCVCIIRTESVDLCCRICIHTSIYILKIDRFSPCKQNVFLCVSLFSSCKMGNQRTEMAQNESDFTNISRFFKHRIRGGILCLSPLEMKIKEKIQNI